MPREKQKESGGGRMRKLRVDVFAVEKQAEKTMTTKEVAEALGVSIETVRSNGKALFPHKVTENGKPILWTESEAKMILEKIRSNNAGSKATSKGALEGITSDLTPALMIKQAMELMQKGYALELERIKAEKERIASERDKLAIELDSAKEWASVKRMEALNPKMRFSWRALKRYAMENGYKMKDVFDQNYGTVKSYPRAVWEAVYGEQIDEAPWLE